MYIKRNDEEYRLTYDELRKAHEEYIKQCRETDIAERVYELCDNNELQDVDPDNVKPGEISEISDMAEIDLNHCDAYYEAYWGCIEESIKQFFAERD